MAGASSGAHAFDALATVPSWRLLKVMVQLSSCVATGWRGLPKKETPVLAVLELCANLSKPGQGLDQIAVHENLRLAMATTECEATREEHCNVQQQCSGIALASLAHLLTAFVKRACSTSVSEQFIGLAPLQSGFWFDQS